MNLKLVLQETGQSWTLEPTRDYFVGSDRTCDINLSQYPNVASRHLRLSCDRVSNIWYVEDLGTTVGTYIDGEAISRSLIEQTTAIKIANSVLINAQPLVLAPIVPPPPAYNPVESSQRSSSYRTEEVRNPGFREAVSTGGRSGFSNQSISPSGSTLKNLSWADYVREQVSQHENIFMRIIVRFSLLTGLRNTPWLNQKREKSIVDGFIIPDFKGSIDTIVQTIENQIGQLRQYEDTDCITAQLTDAHIADSEKGFPGIELFPIRRGKNETRGDYRRFCIASYHRVRTYILIEKYGMDVFVTWITRFEPTSTPDVMRLWLILAISMTLISLVSGNLPLIVSPLLIWSEVYLLVPAIMEGTGMLPKKANAHFVISILLVPSIFLLMSLIGYVGVTSSGSRY